MAIGFTHRWQRVHDWPHKDVPRPLIHQTSECPWRFKVITSGSSSNSFYRLHCVCNNCHAFRSRDYPLCDQEVNTCELRLSMEAKIEEASSSGQTLSASNRSTTILQPKVSNSSDHGSRDPQPIRSVTSSVTPPTTPLVSRNSNFPRISFQKEWSKLQYPVFPTIRLDRGTGYYLFGKKYEVVLGSFEKPTKVLGIAELIGRIPLQLKSISPTLAKVDADCSVFELKNFFTDLYSNNKLWKGENTRLLLLFFAWVERND